MTDDLSTSLAEALRFHRLVWETSLGPACACGYVPDSSLAMEDHRADTLLPIVRAYADQRAAEELRAATGVPLKACCPEHASKRLRDRADTLAGGRLNGQANTETGNPGERRFRTDQ